MAKLLCYILILLRKIWKKLKQLFCKHYYVHLGSNEKIDKFYYWICTKCEKEKRTRRKKY